MGMDGFRMRVNMELVPVSWLTVARVPVFFNIEVELCSSSLSFAQGSLDWTLGGWAPGGPHTELPAPSCM